MGEVEAEGVGGGSHRSGSWVWLKREWEIPEQEFLEREEREVPE